MTSVALLFAYFSPETLLPMTSVIASVVGVLMVFGRTILRLARGLLRVAFGRRRPRPRATPRPHFAERSQALDPARGSHSA